MVANISRTVFLATLLFWTANTLVAELATGALFRSVDGSTFLRITSNDELEFTPDKKSPNWVCKYSRNGDSLRIVLTALGSPQAIYMKVIPEGLQHRDGRKLYDESHFDAAFHAEEQAREERARQQAAATAAFPKPTPTSAIERPLAISAPRPEYPYEARRNKITGSGVVSVRIDSSSGVVVSAEMAQSTGSPILDNAIISAFRRWRFKPGNYQPVLRMPITYTMSGAQY